MKQVAVFRDPDLAAGAGQFGAMHSVAPSFGVEVRPVDVRDAPAIERAITGFASTANGGLIVTESAAAVVHRELIVRLAAQHKLPGVYAGRFYPAVGGLMSLGPNFADQFRQAAGYVDRILGATALPAVPRVAWAQTYPSRPITMIVPFPPAVLQSPGSRAHVPTPGKRTPGHP